MGAKQMIQHRRVGQISGMILLVESFFPWVQCSRCRVLVAGRVCLMFQLCRDHLRHRRITVTSIMIFTMMLTTLLKTARVMTIIGVISLSTDHDPGAMHGG